MEQTVERICRSCGKTVSVPAELTEFSCVYCGEKQAVEQPKPEVPASLHGSEADRAMVEEHLVDCVADYKDYFKHFNKKEYETWFYKYKEAITPVFLAMERYVRANEGHKDELISGFVTRFLDDRMTRLQELRGWKLNKSALLMDSKLTIALFLTPAVRDMKLFVSEPFCEELHAQFVARDPKDVYTPATYEEISAGFRTHKLCFITTAVCEFEGKPDDCEELTAFRAFRDGWLKDQPDGAALTEEYYRVAPAIVTVIDRCDDRAAVYGTIRKDYLQPCYEAIGRGDLAACRETYVEMVHMLQQRYRIS